MIRLALGTLLFLAPLAAQRTTANLYGTVLDPSRGAVAGASIQAVNEATNAVQSAESDSNGEFTLSFLPPGVYRLEAKANGFKTFSQTGLILRAGEQLRLPVALEIGTLADQVTVTAEGVAIENASPTQNDRISRLQLAELPQSRRDFTSLLQLQNGIRAFGQGMFSFNGLATAGNTVTVDGVDGAGDIESNSTSMFNAFNIINVMSQEAIAEVNVAKGAYNAETGRTFSANINVITRGGTN
ncbi:MAG: carboxypeptidase-like regulatory domain-containing protein [Bryobacteraceae bacterium]|nr:carboxypeptidase-like regulatory domain-containing protein [Bryobacteraceae bacterium]